MVWLTRRFTSTTPAAVLEAAEQVTLLNVRQSLASLQRHFMARKCSSAKSLNSVAETIRWAMTVGHPMSAIRLRSFGALAGWSYATDTCDMTIVRHLRNPLSDVSGQHTRPATDTSFAARIPQHTGTRRIQIRGVFEDMFPGGVVRGGATLGTRFHPLLKVRRERRYRQRRKEHYAFGETRRISIW